MFVNKEEECAVHLQRLRVVKKLPEIFFNPLLHIMQVALGGFQKFS